MEILIILGWVGLVGTFAYLGYMTFLLLHTIFSGEDDSDDEVGGWGR